MKENRSDFALSLIVVLDGIMKRTVLALLLVALMAVMLCGCGSKDAAPQEDSAKTAETDAGVAPEDDFDDYGLDYLVLVNRETRLPEDWEEKVQLTESTNSVGDKVLTEKNAYAAYLKLKEDLEKEGIHTELDSAYRSVAEQQKIIDDFTEKYGAEYAAEYAAVPGYTEHHTGLALDLYLIVDGKTVYENEDLVKYPEIWAKIHEKLPEYGFILRYPKDNDLGYPYEEWHIRYVGSPEIAKEIYDRGITLDDYLAEKK